MSLKNKKIKFDKRKLFWLKVHLQGFSKTKKTTKGSLNVAVKSSILSGCSFQGQEWTFALGTNMFLSFEDSQFYITVSVQITVRPSAHILYNLFYKNQTIK